MGEEVEEIPDFEDNQREKTALLMADKINVQIPDNGQARTDCTSVVKPPGFLCPSAIAVQCSCDEMAPVNLISTVDATAHVSTCPSLEASV